MEVLTFLQTLKTILSAMFMDQEMSPLIGSLISTKQLQLELVKKRGLYLKKQNKYLQKTI